MHVAQVAPRAIIIGLKRKKNQPQYDKKKSAILNQISWRSRTAMVIYFFIKIQIEANNYFDFRINPENRFGKFSTNESS